MMASLSAIDTALERLVFAAGSEYYERYIIRYDLLERFDMVITKNNADENRKRGRRCKR